MLSWVAEESRVNASGRWPHAQSSQSEFSQAALQVSATWSQFPTDQDLKLPRLEGKCVLRDHLALAQEDTSTCTLGRLFVWYCHMRLQLSGVLWLSGFESG